MRFIYLKGPDGNDIPAQADEEGRLKTTPALRIEESFNQSDLSNNVYTFQNGAMEGIGVVNDGNDLTFTINSIELEVKSGERFEAYIKQKFNKVAFSSGATFRAYGLK